MKLLVVEDSPLSLELLCEQLKQWGHEAVGVSNGREAWKLLQQEEFSMVLSDWLMPGMDGVELIRRIRRTKSGHYIFCILLTAKNDPEDLVHGMEAGADDFLTKPVHLEELRVRLRAGERVINLERKLSQQNQLLDQANQRMKLDLQAAGQLQQSLLPTEIPDVANIRWAWNYQPCDELGGDFLNVFPLEEEYLGFYIVDVAGHGVAASLLSVAVSRVLTPEIFLSSINGNGNPHSLHEVALPSRVATELNRRLPMEQMGNRFFTMLYGTLHCPTLKLRFVSASHPPVIVLRPGKEPDILKSKGYAIGWFPDSHYQDISLQLTPGSRVFFHSDGLVECRNPQGQMYGTQRMAKLLQACHSKPLERILEDVDSALKEWLKNEKARDDWTILGLEIEK